MVTPKYFIVWVLDMGVESRRTLSRGTDERERVYIHSKHLVKLNRRPACVVNPFTEVMVFERDSKSSRFDTGWTRARSSAYFNIKAWDGTSRSLMKAEKT